MIEAGVVIGPDGPLYWHLPEGRTAGSIPDSRRLWEVLWENRHLDDLGFAHSHPGSGMPAPSMTDMTTFKAIEQGMGRRLTWWITSSDHMIEMYRAYTKEGEEEKYLYAVVEEEPVWVSELRAHSQKETNDGSE